MSNTMGTIFQILKSLLLTTLPFGIAYALCFYLGHFTEVQSVILGLIGLCAIGSYRLAFRIAAKQQPQFEPFRVSIQPNWYSLCRDFGLADVENWGELMKKCKRASSEYSTFHDGISFTMLSPTLFYSNDHQNFFGELDFRQPVEELKPQPDELSVVFAPRFYIKRSLAGEKGNLPVIEFGILTRDSLKESRHPADDRGNIPVARLPEVVFYGYFNSEFDYEQAKRIEKESKLRLTQYEWTEKERDPEDSWLNCPFEVNHKYVRVTYRGIS